MPLKNSVGNMYPWVTHTHTHLGGECPHKCKYCYVDNPRFGRAPRYCGELRLIDSEFDVDYGYGKTIFIEHMNDLFCEQVPHQFINAILDHCHERPANCYVFQTKNPARYVPFLQRLPQNVILGTTVESNRVYEDISKAPSPQERIAGMCAEELKRYKKFVTIEPVLDFDVEDLADMIFSVKPFFVNLGADSKGHGLPEPTVDKVYELVVALKVRGIDLREKANLHRLKGGSDGQN